MTESGGFEQTGAIRDYVVPVVEVEQRADDQLHFRRFRGTAFFIGGQNYGLTAGHVVAGADQLAIMLSGPAGWQAFSIRQAEIHDEHDLAVLTFEPPDGSSDWNSIISGPSSRQTHASLPYQLWGYPDDVAREMVEDGYALFRPDLIFNAGHVRRRVRSVPLPGISGSVFVELSAVAGAGCSGSPLIDAASLPNWALSGVYVGERLDDRSTSVGYAIPADEFIDWRPDSLGGAAIGSELATSRPVTAN